MNNTLKKKGLTSTKSGREKNNSLQQNKVKNTNGGQMGFWIILLMLFLVAGN